MNISVFKDYEELSQESARRIISYVKQKPDAVLCFAGGNTPLGTFKVLVEAFRKGEISFERCFFVGLDEFVGLGREDFGSCKQTLFDHFFTPVGIQEDQISFFDGKAEDLEKECKRTDEFVFNHGGIDLMLLGVGMNGHLGFNEPGVSPDLYCHIVELDNTTQTVGQKYFKEKKVLDRGITLGLKHIMNTENVLLIADGEKKSDIVKLMLEGEICSAVPASYLQRHMNCFFIFDEASASKLNYS